MNFVIPRWLVNAWHAFGDWGDVTYWRHGKWDLRRIDLLLVACFTGSVGIYWWAYGWRGALQAGVMFLVLWMLGLYLRR